MSTHTTLPCITITPSSALIDEPVQIILSGFGLEVRVTVHAQTQDDEGKIWRSQATFISDKLGKIDIATQKPLQGTYQEADAMGLFWSMTLNEKLQKGQSPLFIKSHLNAPTKITFTARVDEEAKATAEVKRLHMAEGVTEILVQEQGLVGKLFMPTGGGPHPGILVLSGSDGRIRERGAALLSSHGYAALALGYFGSAGVPKQLANIPLEYFEKGITWLQQQPRIDKNKIGILGTSRGGELALLLGATFPQVKAVVATAPSGLIHSSVTNNPAIPAWTYQGKPLAFSIYKPKFSEIATALLSMIRKTPFIGVALYEKELQDIEGMKRAAIPVEQIQGPLLLVSGEDDQLWPSTLYAEMIMDRLKRHQHPYSDQHLSYKGAGHLLGVPYSFPYLPPSITPLPNGPFILAFGGKPQESAVADADSWQHILAFFAHALHQ